MQAIRMPSHSLSDRPRLLLVIPYNMPSATIYIVKPLMELARQKRIHFGVVTESEVTVAHLHASDMVLFCRNSDPASDWILEECLYRNIPTVYHLDDNLWEVPQGLLYSDYYNDPQRIRRMERFLSRASLVRVYSQPLLERAQQFNSNVDLVVPCIDMSLVPRTALPRWDDKIRITYVTGRGGGDPLISLISRDLFKLLDAYPDKVEMYWWGDVPAEFLHHPSTRLALVLHDYDQFLPYLAQSGFDIGLAPLTPTFFHLSKTNTKFRDYGACRISGIYSDVEVYSCCVEHEKTGLLVPNTPGAWFDAMQRLLLDADLRRRIQEAAYAYVDQHYRQELVEQQWLEVIDSLLDARRRPAYAQAQAAGAALRLSLVSESAPPAGFIGVAGQRASGVQVIADPAGNLPFASASVGVLLSDWPLEQAGASPLAMQEIYRVCQHGAQVTLLAGYSPPQSAQPAGSADLFNEETPLRWVPSGQGDAAPLADASGIHLHCLGMEFFYSPAVLNLPEQEKKRLRRQDTSVCRRILYRCLVLKHAVTDAELQQLARKPFIEPPGVTVQRLQDDGEMLKGEIVQKHAEIRILKAQLKAKEAELSLQMPRAKLVVQEIDAYRNRKVIRMIERFWDRVDYAAQLPIAYQPILADSRLFFQPLKGYRLRLSQNLQRVSHLAYPVALPRTGLSRVLFAPVMDLYPRQGTLGVQVVESDRVLAEAVLPAQEIQADQPLSFVFPPVANRVDGLLELRLFARDLDVPLYIYEWHHYPYFGLGKQRTKPFCSLNFLSGQ